MVIKSFNVNECPTVHKWGIAEVCIKAEPKGNPFSDCRISGLFTGENESLRVPGFYDGDGVFKVRFTPSYEGTYSYVISGSPLEEEISGSFISGPATEGDHGPLRVVNNYHFAFADGTPYYMMGTTGYSWLPAPEEDFQKTLDELSKGYFNKARIDLVCRDDQRSGLFMYERTIDEDGRYVVDCEHFSPEYFRAFEKQVAALDELGFQVDMILLNPYGNWGMQDLEGELMDMYFRYAAARFASFKNIWFSLSNEFDLIKSKTVEDWEHFASILVENDPYGRLKSIHNWGPVYGTLGKEYDYSAPWITHLCLQRQELYKVYEFEHIPALREKFGKPVLYDEVGYEGNIFESWGNISPEEMTRRFWEGVIRGGYVSHGECYMKEGELGAMGTCVRFKGQSPERIKFLHSILMEVPGHGLKQIRDEIPTTFTLKGGERFFWDDVIAEPEEDEYKGQYYLAYFSHYRPNQRRYHLDDETEYLVELIDTWNMTIERVGVFKGAMLIPMPSKPYMAIRFTRQ